METKQTNSDKFLMIYNDLDRHMRDCLKAKPGTPNSFLINTLAKSNRTMAKFKEDLLTFSRLRNAIIHNPYKKDADPIAEPHDNIIARYEEIVSRITCPPSALSTVAIPRRKVFTTTMDSKVINVMRVMVNSLYTHVPIVDDGRVIGVFSENSVFSYLTKYGKGNFFEDVLIGDFTDFIDIDRNESEYYEFVEKDTLLIDIEEMFQNGLKDNKRLALVFITENGRRNERLLGLVTAWDVAGYKSYF